MPSAIDLITNAAKKLGAIESGASLTAEEANDGLNILNSMTDALSIDRRYIYQLQQESFSWTASAISKTIGSSGDFNTTRPERIEPGTFFRNSSNNDYPVMVTEDRQVYDRLTVKSTTSSYPHILFYDKAFPLGVLYVYPVPSSGLTLKLNSWKSLQNFTSLTASLSMPKGYQRAIEYNLAVDLAPVFGLAVPDSVIKSANKSLASLSRHNATSIIASTEVVSVIGGSGGYNIYADG